jgi:hypothetical protein
MIFAPAPAFEIPSGRPFGDNLTLNVIMLIHRSEAAPAMAGRAADHPKPLVAVTIPPYLGPHDRLLTP